MVYCTTHHTQCKLESLMNAIDKKIWWVDISYNNILFVTVWPPEQGNVVYLRDLSIHVYFQMWWIMSELKKCGQYIFSKPLAADKYELQRSSYVYLSAWTSSVAAFLSIMNTLLYRSIKGWLWITYYPYNYWEQFSRFSKLLAKLYRCWNFLNSCLHGKQW